MNKNAFKPQTLRSILYVLFTVIVIGGAGLFYLGLEELKKYAIEVNHTVADATASGNQVQALQNLKGQLSQSQQLIDKANQMFATPANYQAQTIGDIRNYAAKSGVVVSRTDFDGQTEGPTRTVTVNLRSPVSYSKLIQFLDGIEGNIPKMQVSYISLGHVDKAKGDVVNVDEIKIQVAVR